MKTMKTPNIYSHTANQWHCVIWNSIMCFEHFDLWALTQASRFQNFFSAFDTIFWWIVGISFDVWSASNWSKSSDESAVFKDLLANLFNTCLIASLKLETSVLLLLLKTNILIFKHNQPKSQSGDDDRNEPKMGPSESCAMANNSSRSQNMRYPPFPTLSA